jgi:hypothetical protein
MVVVLIIWIARTKIQFQVHCTSNIAHEDSCPLSSDYLNHYGNIEKISSDIKDKSKFISVFMMVANNYYTPKIFDLTNVNVQEIIISSRDACGELIPIRTSYTGNTGELQEIRQVVFKIEIELVILE